MSGLVSRTKRLVCRGPLLVALFSGALNRMSIAQDTTDSAVSLLKAGRPHDAELSLRRLIAHDPKNASAHGMLGIALAQENDLPAAEGEYRKSLELNPHQPQIVMSLGMSEFKRGRFSEAIPDFKRAAAEMPGDPRPTVLLGMSYFGLISTGDAVPYLQTASAGDPSNLELRNVLAQSCLWSRQFNCAMEEFRNILTVDPNAAQAHMLLAEALDAMGKTEDAIQELEPVAAAPRRNRSCTLSLGSCFEEARLRAGPAGVQAEARNNPGYAQTYLYLGEIAMNTNDDAEGGTSAHKSAPAPKRPSYGVLRPGCRLQQARRQS